MREMIYIEPKSMDAAFHFAAEEYVLTAMRPDAPVVMIWRTGDTVMLGVNQIASKEADLNFARARDIAIVRRSSGGGAIFTDPGTLLYTVIIRRDAGGEQPNVNAEAEALLAAPLIAALKSIGVDAYLQGRNDVLVDGRKVTGMAQYIKAGYLCSHGSLLIDANLDKLERVLTVDAEKIRTKATASVRSRVTNIGAYVKDASALSDERGVLFAFWDRLAKAFDTGDTDVYDFNDADKARIADIRAAKYADSAWTYGRAPAYTFHNAKRFVGGGVEVFFNVKRGLITEARINGDFLALRPVAELERKFEGLPFRMDAVAAAVSDADVKDALGSVSRDEFLSVLFD
jgi:lipoate-protein ligase A